MCLSTEPQIRIVEWK